MNFEVETNAPADVEQLARFLQARDAREFGVVRDGVLYPTWEESSDIGQDEYRRDADYILSAVRVMGFRRPS